MTPLPKEMLGIRRIELGDGGRKVYVYVKNAEASVSIIRWSNSQMG